MKISSMVVAGYITLNGTAKHLYYLLITSQNDPSTDPFLRW